MSGAANLLLREAVIRPGEVLGHSISLPTATWVEDFTRGRPASVVPGLLAAVFNLCGHAHRLCSELVLSAAGSGPTPDGVVLSESLRRETVSEHLRRIAIDWPRLLSNSDDIFYLRDLAQSLPTAPALMKKGPLTAADWLVQTRWLEENLLGVPAPTWWRSWTADPEGWMREWTGQSQGQLPELLVQAGDPDWSWILPVKNRMSEHATTHTGCWSRMADGPQRGLSDWVMLGARIADLVALCLDDGSPNTGPRRLRWGTRTEVPDRAATPVSGAADTGPVAVAWVEMARGLLVHRARLIPGQSKPTVAFYSVAAPTDVNFSPWGEVAHAVAALPKVAGTPQSVMRVQRLMAAFDPCVPFRVDAPEALPTPEAARA